MTAGLRDPPAIARRTHPGTGLAIEELTPSF
jgi:hypothetical protein